MTSIQLFNTIASELGYYDLINTGNHPKFVAAKRVIRLCLFNVFDFKLFDIEKECIKFRGFNHSTLVYDQKCLENAKFTKDVEFLNLYEKAIFVSKRLKRSIKEANNRFDFDMLEQLTVTQ